MARRTVDETSTVLAGYHTPRYWPGQCSSWTCCRLFTVEGLIRGTTRTTLVHATGDDETDCYSIYQPWRDGRL